jgi:phosphatidylinositol alpha-mannosyltransferase
MAQKQKLKIGFVFDDTLDSYDGVAQYVRTLGEWLTKEGHDVRYLVGQTKMREWAGGTVYSLAKNKKVSFNGNQANIPLFASSKIIKQVISKEEFDVLHVQVPYSPLLAQKVINRADVKTAIVGTFHVAPISRLSFFGGHILKIMYGRSIKKFDHIISVSTAAADYAKNAFGLHTAILPNVIETKKFKFAKKHKLSDQHKNILFFGRLVKRKGAAELIEAFNIVAKNTPNVGLIVGGAGPEQKSLKVKVKNYGLKDRVKFLGFIKERDKASLMASADIVCFPSLGGESFGIVLLEAMAAGSGLVIAGNNEGYKSVLGARPQLLFNPNSPNELADKMMEMLYETKTVKELHTWQQAEVKKYDVNEVGPKLFKVYRSAIAKRGVKGDN